MYQAQPHWDAYPETYRGSVQGSYHQPNQGTYQHLNQGNGANGYQQSYQGYQHPYQPNAQPGPPQAPSQPAFSHALSQTNPSSQAPQSTFRQQNFGPRTPNTSAEDPFAQIPYPVSVCLVTRPACVTVLFHVLDHKWSSAALQ